MKRKNTKMLIVLAVLLLGITVGYAILTSNLNINGTTSINNPKWDIHLENIQVMDGSIETVTQEPTISTDKLSVSYAVTLNTPGDYYEFTVDVVNAGTIDGMIGNVTSKINNLPPEELPNYMEYSLTYTDGVEIKQNQLLASGDSETYKVRIGFKKDISVEDLPTEIETFNINITSIYNQSNSSAEAIDHRQVIYTYNLDRNIKTKIGEPIPAEATQYTNIDDIPSSYFLKHIIEEGIVTESYLGINIKSPYYSNYSNEYYNVGTYFLRGGVKESDLLEKPIFEENKRILSTMFINPIEHNSDSSLWYEKGQYNVYVYTNGYTAAFPHSGNGTAACGIYTTGESYCYYYD